MQLSAAKNIRKPLEKSEVSAKEVNKIYNYYCKIQKLILLELSGVDHEEKSYKANQLTNLLVLIGVLDHFYQVKQWLNQQTAHPSHFKVLLKTLTTPKDKREFIELNQLPYLPISAEMMAYSEALTEELLALVLPIIDKMNLSWYCDKDKFQINDVLGQVFEKHINKKESGAYYTDSDTTKYITENTILANLITSWCQVDRDLHDYINQDQQNKVELAIATNQSLFILFNELVTRASHKNSIREIVSSIRILDPTCGSGAFIFSSYKILKRVYKVLGLDEKNCFDYILTHNIFGIDLDPEAIEILNIRVFIESLKLDEPATDITKNFLCGNTLTQNHIFNSTFDCIVGNPPYLEYRKVKDSYSVDQYDTKKCNNLYAFILEKSMSLLVEGGHMGMIIPISYISTKRMTPIRSLLLEQSQYHFCASFADRPACLFNGVHQKLNIILLQKSQQLTRTNAYTSSYIHWFKHESSELFNRISYVKNDFQQTDFQYKIGNDTEKSIIKKITSRSKKTLIDNCEVGCKHTIYLNMRMAFWSKAFSQAQQSKEYKGFSFAQEEHAALFSAVINSNLYFFFWECISDAWHITAKDLTSVSIDFSDFSQQYLRDILTLHKDIENQLEQTKKYIGSVQIDYEYQHKKIKHTLDKLDTALAQYYGLTDVEVIYLRDYQLKYRLNDEYETYIKGLK